MSDAQANDGVLYEWPAVVAYAREFAAQELRAAANGPGYTVMEHGVVQVRVVKAAQLDARADALTDDGKAKE